MKEIRNLRLLEETGKKTVCVVTWQLNEEKRNRALRRALEENGFRVRFAAGMDGLMRRFVRLKLSARLTAREHCTQAVKYALLVAREAYPEAALSAVLPVLPHPEKDHVPLEGKLPGRADAAERP